MKTVYLIAAAAAAVAAATPAAAANFTGIRGEIHGGWDHLSVNDEEWGLNERKSGVTYGVGVGYDVALGSNIIAGIEANFDLASTKFSLEEDGATASIRAKRDIEVAARLGTKVSDNVVIYAKAGYTNARLRGEFTEGSETEVLTGNGDGLRLGAGLEVALSPNAYIKAEYRYSNYEGGVTRNQVITGIGFRF